MLKIINDLKPFFDNCYARVNVREYARLTGITPPTASALLKYYQKEGLLLSEKDRNYILFRANSADKTFINLSRIYWSLILSDLVHSLEKELIDPTVILFGSLSKAEAKPDSDIDIAIFTDNKEIGLSEFRKKLKREIHALWYKSFNDIKNNSLKNNIANGYVLSGRVKL